MEILDNLIKAAEQVCKEFDDDNDADEAFKNLEVAMDEAKAARDLLKKSGYSMYVPAPPEDLREVAILGTLIKQFNPGVIVIDRNPLGKKI